MQETVAIPGPALADRRARSRTRFTLAAIGLLAALAATILALPAGARAAAPPVDVKVMTRNLYLGTDIMRPIVAIQDKQDAPIPELLTALANATDTARAIVDQTDFGTRAGLLADEIAGKRPDLVGLQEVALWRSGPLQLPQAAITNATVVDYDFLAMLRAELKSRGVPYRPVSVNWLSDVEAPSFGGTVQAPTNPRDVRLTMRDVILKRVGSGVKVLGHHEKTYRAGIDITIAGQKLNFTRGYQWVDATRDGQRFRFINTHLEAFSSDIAYAQAAELLANAPAQGRTNLFVCDCNSDPLNHSVKPIDHVPHSAPYDLITRTYTDQWLRWRPAAEGWTSGLSETVDDPDLSSIDHRIDMVFGRGADGEALPVDKAAVVGKDPDERTPATAIGRLWPSDHAGVVARLQIR